ncbi:MAG: DUF1178 family protein [Pseudomonadota bacterium]|nr:DUF1178 family protein [Pseudomonadota bacterium]
MIVFDLRCASAHVFEAWFASSDAYDEQRERGLLACPVCGDGEVGKAVMAPNVGTKGNGRSVHGAPASGDEPTPAAMKAALRALAKAQATMLRTSEWVGTAFADRARAMHIGDETPATIHGQTTRAEAHALIEEGVPVAPLPLPVAPPDTIN